MQLLGDADRYKIITLTHANLKRPVELLLGAIAGWHYSETYKATNVYTVGGIFPVAESIDNIKQAIKQALAQPPDIKARQQVNVGSTETQKVVGTNGI